MALRLRGLRPHLRFQSFSKETNPSSPSDARPTLALGRRGKATGAAAAGGWASAGPAVRAALPRSPRGSNPSTLWEGEQTREGRERIVWPGASNVRRRGESRHSPHSVDCAVSVRWRLRTGTRRGRIPGQDAAAAPPRGQACRSRWERPHLPGRCPASAPEAADHLQVSRRALGLCALSAPACSTAPGKDRVRGTTHRTPPRSYSSSGFSGSLPGDLGYTPVAGRETALGRRAIAIPY